MTIQHENILGTYYEVSFGDIKEIGLSEDLTGQCSRFLKKIVVEHSMRDCECETEKNRRTQETTAHEVFHAFVHESGLELEDDVEERLAVWFSRNWRKMNNTIIDLLDKLDILDD